MAERRRRHPFFWSFPDLDFDGGRKAGLFELEGDKLTYVQREVIGSNWSLIRGRFGEMTEIEAWGDILSMQTTGPYVGVAFTRGRGFLSTVQFGCGDLVKHLAQNSNGVHSEDLLVAENIGGFSNEVVVQLVLIGGEPVLSVNTTDGDGVVVDSFPAEVKSSPYGSLRGVPECFWSDTFGKGSIGVEVYPLEVLIYYLGKKGRVDYCRVGRQAAVSKFDRTVVSRLPSNAEVSEMREAMFWLAE